MRDTALATDADWDVLVVGGGVAGLTGATYLARAGLATLVVSDGESILRRNAHLENVPGFPAGVNPRLFVDLLSEQAERNGAKRREGRVVDLDGSTGSFAATLADATGVRAARVLATSWADADYLDGVGAEVRDAGSKRYVAVDEVGRTSVEGVYAAGRITEAYHQTAVAAGRGAEAAITLIHDADVPYYHDWVAPEGYFTDRGRPVPPACEEIDATEQARRQRESRELMRERFADPHPDRQRTHPSLSDDDLGRIDGEDWDMSEDG